MVTVREESEASWLLVVAFTKKNAYSNGKLAS